MTETTVEILRTLPLVSGLPTMGELTTDSFKLYTLELPWLNNDPQTSCIPAGKYLLPIAWSERFKRLMPRLLGVPGRSGILIHNGNYPKDTEGCILVGTGATAVAVWSSNLALDTFFDWLGKAWALGPVYVNITEKGTA